MAATEDWKNHWMEMALHLAMEGVQKGKGGPFGCIIVKDNEVVGKGSNAVLSENDPTAHAEILALRAACDAAGSERLPGHALYVTLEPCPMCAAAISFARIARLYYGAADPKSGGVAQGARVFAHPQCHHAPEVYDGIAERDAAALLRAFFEGRRNRCD